MTITIIKPNTGNCYWNEKKKKQIELNVGSLEVKRTTGKKKFMIKKSSVDHSQ